MNNYCRNKQLLLTAILGLILSALSPNLYAEELTRGQEMAEAESFIETTVQGAIERAGEDEVVIGDRLYEFAPGSYISKSSLAVGQYVKGELDKQGRILSLHSTKRPETKQAGTSNSNPEDNTSTKSHQKKQDVILEDGVWKNMNKTREN
jgi:hypothetical protein